MTQETTVLIVDDTLLARLMLRKAVSNLRPQWHICEAKDGNDALEKVQGKIIDVALIDYNMPGMNGLDLARKLKEKSETISMAIVTANIQDYIINEAKSLGIEFISKPIEEQVVRNFFNAIGK